MVRAFIVDDEPPARVRLRQLLSEAGDVVVVGEAGDAVEARTAIGDTRPDVVFLDIEMPETSGTDLARTLPEPRPYIVFATAYDRYALAAFAVDATDYLVKPITRARLAETLTRVRDRLSRRSDLERDLVEASAAQQMLLRRHFPPIAGYDSAALTVPARGVGGDFFLSQQIGSTRHVLALGDVSGKGMPAGIVASSLQARIETMARHAGGSATEVVADVNRALCETSEGARYATLAYIDLDTALHALTIVNAGHLPVIVLMPDGVLQLVSSTSPAVGMFPEARFEAATVNLPYGSLVVIYSDGVTEATNVDEGDFDQDRLLEVVRRLVNHSASDVCDGILDAVRGHTQGGRAMDDITVLAIRRTVDPVFAT